MNLKKFTLISFLIISLLGGTYFYTNFYKEDSLPFNIYGSHEGSIGVEKWVQFTPKENLFSIDFPEKPKANHQNLPIPGSKDVLPYQEYTHLYKKDYLFSIGHASLPESWLKWGSSLVLKGGFKFIIGHLGKVNVIGKCSNTFKNYPSLDYEHNKGKMETTGTLILIDKVLYKIEITYPIGERDMLKKELRYFIESFSVGKLFVNTNCNDK